MKTYKYITIIVVIFTSLLFVQCSDDDDNGNVLGEVTCDDGIKNGDETGIDCGGSACEPCAVEALDFSGNFQQEDQMGRPGINTVFGTTGMKDAFNVTIPSEMGAAFQSSFESNLMALNPDYTTNLLGLDATVFTTVLASDALWVAETGVTTYYNGTEVLTGRNLTDDVIDVSLILIFGGPDGSEKPTLTSDFVSSNDATFSTSFPYVASPF
ncbi:DUF4331 family protein [Ulvibacter litoralis]|uniref:DUF4331 domain-containing protein n=1 Tax=Ulvibacter litoralis TaxID=227084 RepID=A0A1G7F153_9FLAO|nr:DUF4331 family protein [Ulvibacter litoralis]GHC53230.1 hypothetical protein GCM10008083_16510 [Ulvibacter litoralis]SDE69325.1 protein of unknown function [Ulvibacter litoralis]